MDSVKLKLLEKIVACTRDGALEWSKAAYHPERQTGTPTRVTDFGAYVVIAFNAPGPKGFTLRIQSEGRNEIVLILDDTRSQELLDELEDLLWPPEPAKALATISGAMQALNELDRKEGQDVDKA